ncbi:MAG: TfoX/Sxy family protein [Alphaproteobacteria bacterium]
MPQGQEFAEHARDLLTSVGAPFDQGTRLRRMFGGHGIFCDGVMFALIADETLYLKVDGETKPAFLEAGCESFTYDKGGKPVEMSYVTAPDDAAEDIDALRPWAHMALAAANRTQAKKKPRKS